MWDFVKDIIGKKSETNPSVSPIDKEKSDQCYKPTEQLVDDSQEQQEDGISPEQTNLHTHYCDEETLNEPGNESGSDKDDKLTHDERNKAYDTVIYERKRKSKSTLSKNLSNNRNKSRAKYNYTRNLPKERKKTSKHEFSPSDNRRFSDDIKQILIKAVKLKLNHENCGLTLGSERAYIRKAGGSEDLLTEKLIRTFTTYYSRYKRSAMPEMELPIIEQPFFQHCLQKYLLDDQFILYLRTVHEAVKNARKAFIYSYVGETNFLQLRLDNIGGNTDAVREIQDVYHQVNKRIISFVNENCCKSIGEIPFSKKHMTFHIYNDGCDKEDENPHKDYPDIGSSNIYTNDFSHAWICHIPISDNGMWINLWLTPGYAKSIKVEYGSILLIRSDVVFGGCMPILDDCDNIRYERLCMYLDSKDQIYIQGFTNVLCSDLKTPLSHSCYKPINDKV